MRVQELSGSIQHLDEVLTMSARMAATTGDAAWEARYAKHEPLLDAAIKALIAISPVVFEQELGTETDAANQRLVALEHESFELVRHGQSDAARRLLFSAEYQAQKELYATGWSRTESALRTAVAAEAQDLMHRLASLGALSVAAVLALGLGVLRLGAIRRRMRDQSARERAEVAEAAATVKGQFLANMSHEIRTPMTAILGYADLLSDPTQNPEQQRACAHIIRRNGQHLLSVINDILDLSKIEAGAMTVQRETCSPLQVVHDVLSLMQVRANASGVQLRAEHVLPLPLEIHTDPMRLRQILLNLVGNAIKFTPRGDVVVTVRFAGAEMAFNVRDTGIGMDAEQRSHLFRAFSQVDGSTRRRFGGTGLGLAISKRLALMLGGDIDVTSTPDVGSVFTLRVETGAVDVERLARTPAEVAVVRHGDGAQDARKSIPLAGRILLAEDGLDNQRLVRFHLERAGASVNVVDNGQQALDAVARANLDGEPFDLVLMDMQMPELDGYAATRCLRRDGQRMPIVALTAHAMVGDRERCLAAGCDDHLTKPIDRARLLATCALYLTGSPFAASAHRAGALGAR